MSNTTYIHDPSTGASAPWIGRLLFEGIAIHQARAFIHDEMETLSTQEVLSVARDALEHYHEAVKTVRRFLKSHDPLLRRGDNPVIHGPLAPTRLPNLSEADAKRFWSKVKKTDGDGCWLWKGGLSKSGYGHFKAQGKMMRAHRIAYFLHLGKDPFPFLICHNCPTGDNPACVRPDHMFLGDNLENTYDRHKKGRSSGGRPFWKREKPKLQDASSLSNEDLAFICSRYSPTGEWSASALGRKFNISTAAIRKILATTLSFT